MSEHCFAECHLCRLCHLCCVSHISVFIQSAVKLSVIMLSVVAPIKQPLVATIQKNLDNDSFKKCIFQSQNRTSTNQFEERASQTTKLFYTCHSYCDNVSQCVCHGPRMIFAGKSGSPKRGIPRGKVEMFVIDKRIILKRCAVKKSSLQSQKNYFNIFFLTDRAKDHDLANQ